MKTQDWVETSVYFDNDICPTISASGVSLSVIMLVPSHAEFLQIYVHLLYIIIISSEMMLMSIYT